MNGNELLMQLHSHLNAAQEACQEFAATTEAALYAARPHVLAIDAENTPHDDSQLLLDMATFNSAPVAVVPRYSPFQPLLDNGHRFLVASDGIFLEVRRPWLYFVSQLGGPFPVRMPFGSVPAVIELAWGRLGGAIDLMRDFVAQARDTAPLEDAALIGWDAAAGRLFPQPVSMMRAPTSTSVQYQMPALADHESIAIDLHSHGHIPAFFSDTDNADDAGSVKISGVIGDLDKPEPTALFRLCVLGLYIPIAVPAAALFADKQA